MEGVGTVETRHRQHNKEEWVSEGVGKKQNTIQAKNNTLMQSVAPEVLHFKSIIRYKSIVHLGYFCADRMPTKSKKVLII